MKKFKPIIFLIPENTNDVFIDIERFVAWKKESPVNEAYCRDGVLVLGRQIFVFDVDSCEFFKKEVKQQKRSFKSMFKNLKS